MICRARAPVPGLRVGAGRTHHPVSDGSNSLGSFTEDRVDYTI